MTTQTHTMVRFIALLCVFLAISLQFREASSQESDAQSNSAEIDNDTIFKELAGDDFDDYNGDGLTKDSNSIDGNDDGDDDGNNSNGGGEKQTSKDSDTSSEAENLQEVLALASTAVSWLKIYLKDSYDKVENPSVCLQDSARLVDQALNNKKWTIPFIDSAGKPGPSVTQGWMHFVGNLDQCESGRAPPPPPQSDAQGQSPKTKEQGPAFKGQYCVITLAFVSMPEAQPKFGVCVPDSCSDTELNAFSSQILTQYNTGSNLTLVSVECIKNETEVSTATIISFILLAVLVSLAIAGTTFDILVVQRQDDSMQNGFDHLSSSLKSTESSALDFKTKSISYDTISSTQSNGNSNHTGSIQTGYRVHPMISNTLLAFSFYTNGKKVMSTSQGQDSIGALNGIRYLSIGWVLLGHLYMLGINHASNAATEREKYFYRASFAVVSNSFCSVDTFFAMSGLLTSYAILKDMRNKQTWKINWGMYYFHRFWRLTPPYMSILLLNLGLSQYFGSGPMWQNHQPYDKKLCEDNWWRNLLYINNFEEIFNSCMMHSWYLANDMQFFLISPLMTVPLFINRKIGLACCGVLILVSWIATGVSSSVNDWVTVPFAKHNTLSESLDWAYDYYTKPWFRLGPYIVGIVAGYILTLTKGKSFKVKWYLVAIGWFLATVAALSIVFGPHGDLSGKSESSTDVAALYNTVVRTIWGVVICGIIIACDSGYGGPVNAFLTWKPFIVLGRLTYMTYLIHLYVLVIFYQNMGQPFYMNDTTMAVLFTGNFAVSTALALFFMLLLESPMIGLEKVFLGNKKGK